MKIELGREVRDRVTGLIGIATSRVEYLNGCYKIGIQPKVKKDGTHPDCMFIDEPQVEYTKNTKHILGEGHEESRRQSANRGGPVIRGSSLRGI